MFQGFTTQKSKISQEGGDKEKGSKLLSTLWPPDSIFCPATPVSKVEVRIVPLGAILRESIDYDWACNRHLCIQYYTHKYEPPSHRS